MTFSAKRIEDFQFKVKISLIFINKIIKKFNKNFYLFFIDFIGTGNN